MPHRLLLVDDESSILNSLKRLLRPEKYEIDATISPQEALGWLRERRYALIVSDQRMPDMEGTVFLEKAREIAPDSVRILLTGYADMQAAIDAINRSAVYRFLTKPWNDDDLKVALRRAIEHGELEKGFVTTVKLLSQMGTMHSSRIGDHSKRVAELSKKIAQVLTVPEATIFQIEMAAILHDIGKIAVPTSILEKEESRLSEVEMSQLKKHVLHGELIALMIPNLAEAARIIRHHHEKFDGTGFPDKLRSSAIPIGSRIIAASDQFDKCLNADSTLAPEKVCDFLEGSRKEFFDPEILRALRTVVSVKEAPILRDTEICLSVDKLTVGMKLSRDVKTVNDLLILPQGISLDERTISLLQKYVESAPVAKDIFVHRT